MSTIICWNESKFKKELSSIVEKAFPIADEGELINKLGNSDVELIFVLIELNWKQLNFTDFYGLKIGQRLRREYRITAPIIFFSFLPEKYYYHQERLVRESQILKGRGSYFLQLPFTKEKIEETLKQAKPLSKASLIDVTEKCCDPIGTIIDKLHPLKSQINKITKSDFDKLKNDLENFLSQEQKANLDFLNAMNAANEKLESHDYDGFRDKIQELESNCIKLFNTAREIKQINTLKSTIPCLLLEDDIEICNTIEKELSKRNIEIKSFLNVNEAMEEIKNDSINKYCVVIADWRLYKDSEKWQDYQGYEFLEVVAKTHFFAPIALTSLNDSSVHEIRNNLSIKIDLFKKEHLINDNNWNIFADVIHQKYNDITDLITSCPSAPEWYKTVTRKRKGEEIEIPSYFEQYRKVRNSINWESFEQKISIKADKLWENFKNIFNDPRSSVAPLKEFGIEINHTIENLLIVRRIWLALWFKRNSIYQKDSIRAIYEIINEGDYDQSSYKGPEEKTSSKDNVFASSLAIRSKELPKELLPEERRWLQKHNISIDPEIFDEMEMEEEALEEREPTTDEIKEIEKNGLINTPE